MKEEVIELDTVDKYNKFFKVETYHPMVTVVDLSKITQPAQPFTINYGIYALFLKDTLCGDITYGRQPYDYQEGTIVCFAPGQVASIHAQEGTRPTGYGLLFHPDLIHGTQLGHDIRNYSFFSYEAREALHLSEEERHTVIDCLHKIDTELRRPADKHSRRLITANIGLLLDYCMRFYERQFITRSESNKSVLVKFEALLDDYFQSDKPQTDGLPSVKYFADKVFLSPNYFGDLIKKETGKSAQEYIQTRMIDIAKEMIAGTEKTVSQIAYELGFQYSQHFNRIFKKNTGYTPGEYRKLQI